MEDTHLSRTEIKALVDDLRPRVDDSWECYKLPWDDVFASMLKHHDKVRWSEKKCAACMNPLIEIFFESPSWTWKHLCGSCGTMTICPICAKQLSYKIKWRS